MLYVNSCGHDSHHPRPCDIEHKNGLPDYLVLLIKKEAWIVLDGRRQQVRPNALICFPPHTYIHYGCDEAGYNDDWIHFLPGPRPQAAHSADCPYVAQELSACAGHPYVDEKGFPESLGLPLGQITYPCDFHRLSEYVRLLSENYHSSSVYKEEIADSFLRIFLYSLKEELERQPASQPIQKYYADFSALRTQIYNNPAAPFRIPELASSLNLSLSYFQHLYKAFFHCSCSQDIISARLALARYYLTNSNMSIRNLALFCGYENELHFMRQFKKFVGMTPSKYRDSAERR